jgi:transposase-like protein
VWKCKGCAKQFSVKVGTIFEDSPLGLDKWLPAIWLIANTKNGTSSWELHRDLGITQKSAWFMAHRIRRAMQTGSFDKKLCGEIEADESFVGGKARNMHHDKRVKTIHGRGPSGKAIVMAVLERHGEIRTAVVPSRKKQPLQSFVREHVEFGSDVFTDELKSYDGLSPEFAHQVINHAEKYVDGQVHTNNCENFWSLLKRGIHGTYVSVEPFHLFRYLDEQAFRYNKREQTDSERFLHVCSAAVGRRLTWKELIGDEDGGEA